MSTTKERRASNKVVAEEGVARRKIAEAEAVARKVLQGDSDPYSNRELDAKFKTVTDALAEHFTDLMTAIGKVDTKVGIQNGRVAKLEGWRGMVVGALAVITLIVVPAVGYLCWLTIADGQSVGVLESQMASVLQALKPQ